MFKTIRVVSVLALAALSPLVAADSSALHVTIPFAFIVAGETLPAGDYVVDASSNSGIVMIQGAGRGVVVLSSPGSVAKQAKPGLIFQNRTGSEYLISVKTADDSSRQIAEVLKPTGKLAALAAVAAK